MVAEWYRQLHIIKLHAREELKGLELHCARTEQTDITLIQRGRQGAFVW